MFDLAELERAHSIVGAAMPPTPAHAWPLLAERLGTQVVVKHENHTPIGAFKVRGGLTYLDRLKREQPGVPGIISVTGSKEYGRVVVEVVDNGRGIDPRDHERIFDLFRRSGTQDQPGEGIGLAHARALAYRLGGFIEVKSVLGEGSVFRLILPSEWRGENSDE